MSSHDPIAYTYMADYHCKWCTRRAFPPSDVWPGIDQDGNPCLDGEGNEVGAVFPWDEWFNVGEGDQTLVCGDCGALLAEYEEEPE